MILKINTILLGIIILCCFSACNTDTGFEHFITVQDDKLMDGENKFRFISCNIPNLHYVEDNMKFDKTIPFRFPDEFEIRDALESIQQMGGQVVRTYTLSVRREDDPDGMPRHVLNPGEFNEEGFIALDKCLQVANELGIRLIIPFVDNWSWWGGRAEYAAFRHKSANDFWSDPEIIADFKKTIEFVINRTNTFTGVSYKKDKAILCWETGNELQSPPEWTADIAAYIKSIDPNHLVLDGFHSSVLRDFSISDPNIDFVTTHHYQKNPQQIVDLINSNVEKARGIKPYFVGEFGFIPTDGVRQVLDTVIESGCSGALIWSLRTHNTDGGFYWHSEPYGGNLFKSYHWPGFSSGDPFDARNCIQLVSEKAFQISKRRPEQKPPKAPVLLPINDVAEISWQGSAGASGYTIERSESQDGPWDQIAENVSDADVQYRPLFNDETADIGKAYYYRVSAINDAGTSPPSNIVTAPVVKHHTLVDECANWNLTHETIGQITLKNDEARKSKEDAHRFRGQKGDAVIYNVTQDIVSFKIYSFFPGDIKDFNVFYSSDGENFAASTLQRQEYYSGEGEYDYYYPVLFSSQTIPPGSTWLKIQFPTEVEVSRVEVKYGS